VRAVVQRVSRAQVRVGSESVAEMGPGLLALVGVADGDAEEDATALARKLTGLRIFPDDQGRMERSLLDVGGSLGVVSQFTLLGDARRGRRPSYAAAAAPELARPLIESLVGAARAEGAHVVTGRFGAMMEVELVNTGPVTLLLDSRRLF
jgi:D-tyrosyl-tRNA(Tyr) deacylase